MKKILGIILFFYVAFGGYAIANGKATPSIRPYAVTNHHDSTSVLVITDRPGNIQYITTLDSKGARAQTVFGSSRGRVGGAKPATWYTHRLPASLRVEGMSDMTPPGSFSGVADISGNRTGLNSAEYGQKNNPILSAAALNALAHAPVGSQKKLSFREMLSNGQIVRVSNDVTKAAQLTLSAPSRPWCQSGSVGSEKGYICRLRKVDVSSNINNGGDIYFSLRTNIAMPKARYRVGAEWKDINSVTPVSSLAKANYIEFFFVPPQKLDGMTLTGRILEMAFFSRSRQAIGDRIRLSVSGRELGLDKNGITAARLKLLTVRDGVSGESYLTTQGSARQRIFGTSNNALLWRLDSSMGKVGKINTVNPPAYFSNKTRSLPNGTLAFSAAGSAKLFSLALGQQQFLRVGGKHTDNTKFMHLTSAISQSHIELAAADGKNNCRQITVGNETGMGCTLRTYVVKGGINGSQLRFGISGLTGAKFKVNTQWHAFNDDIPLTEFARTGRIDVFVSSLKGALTGEHLFKARFYSNADKARGDEFTIKLTQLSSKLKALRERSKQLGVMLIDDAVTNTHYITTLSSNTVQAIYGDQATARWYPLGRIKRAKNVKNATIEKQLSVKRVEPSAFFSQPAGNKESALFQGLPLSTLAWSTLDTATVGQRFPFSYTMNAKGKEWKVTQEVTKQAALQLDAVVNASCQLATVEGVKGKICPLRAVTLNGTIPENTLSVAIRGGDKSARYRFNSSAWIKSGQMFPVKNIKNGSGVLSMFTPNKTEQKLKKQNDIVLELHDKLRGASLFILLINKESVSDFSVHINTMQNGSTGYAEATPGEINYVFSVPSSADGMILRPSVSGMNIGHRISSCYSSSTPDTLEMFSPVVNVTFKPSMRTFSLDLSDSSNYINIPPYSSEMNVAYETLVPKYRDYCHFANDDSYKLLFLNNEGGNVADSPFVFDIALPQLRIPVGRFSYFQLVSPVAVPGSDVYIKMKAGDLSHDIFYPPYAGAPGQKFYLQCYKTIPDLGLTSQGLGGKYYIYDEDNNLMNTGGTDWTSTVNYKTVLTSDKTYFIKATAATGSTFGAQLAIQCKIRAETSGGMTSNFASVATKWGDGHQYLYGVNSPSAAPAKIMSQQIVSIVGATADESNLSYKLSLSDGGDVNASIDDIKAINFYTGHEHPLTAVNGDIPLTKNMSNSFFIRFTPKATAIGKTLITEYHLSTDPADKIFSDSIPIVDSLYLNNDVAAPDTIAYGSKGSFSYRLNRVVTAEDKGLYALKFALQHKNNSSFTAVVGTHVSPEVTVKYLPGGEIETVSNATNLVTLHPPVGTTGFEATVTSLVGEEKETTLGMMAQTLYLTGLDGIETTSSVTKSTRLINFGLLAITDTTAKEGSPASQILTYTESKTDDDGFYLRYQPAVTEHPTDNEDYDLSNVTLLFSDGTTRMIDLTGVGFPKVIVPKGTSSVEVSVPIVKDTLNEWSDEKGLLQASLSDDFADVVEGTLTITNALAPSVFDITLEALGGGSTSGNFNDSEPATVEMNLTRIESNAPKPDQEMDVKTYLTNRMTSALDTKASLLGSNIIMSGKTSCAFSLNGSSSISVPMRAQLRYTKADGSSIITPQDCTGIKPVSLDDGEWILQSKDDDAGIEERLLKLNAEFPLDDSFSAFNSEHKGWEGTVKGSGTVSVDIRFLAP